MAIQKIHRAKSTKPRSPILILLASVACIAVLYLASSVVSTIGFSFSTPRSLKNLVKNPKNHRVGHEKYLYWGNKIDCPGKHCESCEGLGHQESSLRCALEEALFLESFAIWMDAKKNSGSGKCKREEQRFPTQLYRFNYKSVE